MADYLFEVRVEELDPAVTGSLAGLLEQTASPSTRTIRPHQRPHAVAPEGR